MHHRGITGTISLILVFILFTFGCAAGKNPSANEDFGLFAETVPEGIRLNFANIPADVTHMWLNVVFWSDEEYREDKTSLISSFAAITNASAKRWVNASQQLERIRQTGSIIFPIVRAGVNYHFSATVYNEHEYNNMREVHKNSFLRTAYANIIANNGTYFNRENVMLELDKTNAVATIVTEPLFSSELIFYEQKYSFAVTIIVDSGKSIGFGDHHFPDGLSCNGLS
ncbi:MAG: hypothetical protein FWC36_02235 [Spirochaetes bacterium]|nr:hypothetical protein [Spirochaetota bacterium]